MKIGTLVRIIADVLPILEKDGLIDAQDNFVAPSVEQWATIASQVEAVVKAHGVTVQVEVDKIIQGLPFILALLGVK